MVNNNFIKLMGDYHVLKKSEELDIIFEITEMIKNKINRINNFFEEMNDLSFLPLELVEQVLNSLGLLIFFI
jgi:hypothetical protein